MRVRENERLNGAITGARDTRPGSSEKLSMNLASIRKDAVPPDRVLPRDAPLAERRGVPAS